MTNQERNDLRIAIDLIGDLRAEVQKEAAEIRREVRALSDRMSDHVGRHKATEVADGRRTVTRRQLVTWGLSIAGITASTVVAALRFVFPPSAY